MVKTLGSLILLVMLSLTWTSAQSHDDSDPINDKRISKFDEELLSALQEALLAEFDEESLAALQEVLLLKLGGEPLSESQEALLTEFEEGVLSELDEDLFSEGEGLFSEGEDLFSESEEEVLENFADEEFLEELGDELLSEFEDGELAESLQIFTILGVASGVSGARFSIDGDEGDSDLDIKSIKLPIRRELKGGDFCFVAADDQRYTDYEIQSLARTRSDDALCTKPYAELTLSYLQADQRFELDETTSLKQDVIALSALAGLGLTFKMTERTVFRPILLGGYSFIEDSGGFEGEAEEFFNQALDGSLADADLHTFLFGGAAELVHKRRFENDVELEGRFRYNHLVSSVFDASDDVLEGTNDFVVMSGNVEASVPTGYELFSREVRALGFGGTNILWTSFGQKITADDFIHEVGGGLELNNPPLVKGVRLRGSVLFGEDISGWRAGVAVKF